MLLAAAVSMRETAAKAAAAPPPPRYAHTSTLKLNMQQLTLIFVVQSDELLVLFVGSTNWYLARGQLLVQQHHTNFAGAEHQRGKHDTE